LPPETLAALKVRQSQLDGTPDAAHFEAILQAA